MLISIILALNKHWNDQSKIRNLIFDRETRQLWSNFENLASDGYTKSFMKLSSGCYKRLQFHKRRMQDNMDSSMEKSSRYIMYQFFETHLLKYPRKKKRERFPRTFFYIGILRTINIRANFSKFLLHCVIHNTIIIIIKGNYFFLNFSSFFFSSCNLLSISSLVLQLSTKKSLSRKLFCTP